MAHDFIPRRDQDFVSWSANLSARISATPEAFGLTPAMAADYAALNAALQVAYNLAVAPSTRTTPRVMAKNSARRAAEREARRLARLVQAAHGVSDVQRYSLGLTVRDTTLTPVRRPVEQPWVTVKLVRCSTVRIELHDRGSTRRGKPDGVAGAAVLSYVGDTPPADPPDFRAWTVTNTTRPRINITFQDVVPGAKVWIAARWFNARMQAGPISEPAYTYIQCPTLMLGNANLRIAA